MLIVLIIQNALLQKPHPLLSVLGVSYLVGGRQVREVRRGRICSAWASPTTFLNLVCIHCKTELMVKKKKKKRKSTLPPFKGCCEDQPR